MRKGREGGEGAGMRGEDRQGVGEEGNGQPRVIDENEGRKVGK